MHGAADALAYGVKVTGCTLFVVDAGVDTGPIVAQAAVPVLDDDTVESLHERIKAEERRDAGRRGRPDRPRGVHGRGPGGPFRPVTRVVVMVCATRLAQVGNHQGVRSPSIDRLGARLRSPSHEGPSAGV